MEFETKMLNASEAQGAEKYPGVLAMGKSLDKNLQEFPCVTQKALKGSKESARGSRKSSFPERRNRKHKGNHFLKEDSSQTKCDFRDAPHKLLHRVEEVTQAEDGSQRAGYILISNPKLNRRTSVLFDLFKSGDWIHSHNLFHLQLKSFLAFNLY